MKIKNQKLSILFVLITFFGFTQNEPLRDATVVAVISMGPHEYSIVLEIGTDNYFKSSPASPGVLTHNMNVQIKSTTGDIDIVEVIDPTIIGTLFAKRIDQSGGGMFFPPTDRMPVLENEILFFESEEHIREVYDLVLFYLEKSSAQNSEDIKLNLLENNYPGFTSYRNHFISKHNLFHNKFTEAEIEGLAKEDFINDDIHKTLFNEHRLIGVGDSIYYYHDINTTLIIQKNDAECLQILKNVCVEKDNGLVCDLYSATSVVWQKRRSRKIKIVRDSFVTYDPGDEKGTTVVNQYYRYQTIPDFGGFPCEPYIKWLAVPELYENYEYLDSIHYLSFWNSSVQLSINWGDGSIVEVIPNYLGQPIGHVYQAGIATTYYPSTNLTFINSNGGVTNVQDGTYVPLGHDISFNTNIACTSNNAETYGIKTVGNWQIMAKLWTSHNWLGEHIGSFTWSFSGIGNSWSFQKASIATFVDGIFRNSACVEEENKAGSKHHSNDKKIQITKTKSSANYSQANGDVTSYHTLTKGSTSIGLSMVLNPCQ